jgi:hypothetical protein
MANTKNQHAHPDAPKPIHPDKEHFLLPLNNSAGSKHPNFWSAGLCRNGGPKIRNSIFPVNKTPELTT